MIDWFVLLTPLLLLGVVMVLGFVGCDRLLGLVPLQPINVVINALMPDTGPTVGGTPVRILGSDFSTITSVTFGGVDATDISVLNVSEVDVVSPPNVAGPVDVVVHQDTYQSNPLTFTYAAIGFVQLAAIEQAAIKTPPLAVTMNNTAAGNLLIAAVSFAGPDGGSVTVADNLGNSFMLAGNGPWFRQSSILYLPNISGGTVTITVTGAGGASGPCSLCVSEYSGADTTSAAVYGFGSNHVSTGTPGIEAIQGIAVTPASSGDLAYAIVFTTQDTALMPGAGLTQRATPVSSMLVEDATSAITPGQTIATDDSTGGSFVPWVALGIAIKAA